MKKKAALLLEGHSENMKNDYIIFDEIQWTTLQYYDSLVMKNVTPIAKSEPTREYLNGIIKLDISIQFANWYMISMIC